ncbi:hypothetical protein AB0D46_24785 [Streptomyces sp. NPDC048383]|uniref:hypothetical protein n=1 Tax=Streptomyces sp. NPDC048383 TaxID=3155386 RepID=UPI00342C8ECB
MALASPSCSAPALSARPVREPWLSALGDLESGYWGVTGEITAPDGAGFIVGVDHEGDFYVQGDSPEPTFLMEYFDCTSASDGLDEVTKRVVAVIRDIA